MNIGIIREGKVPVDRRTPLSPQQCKEVKEKFPHVNIFVQQSPVRCFKDQEYEAMGFPVQEDMSNCDILMGIKEVPVRDLIAGKTYLFFSHTIKKQPYNRNLLREIIARGITMIDYETLKDTNDVRIVAFGRYAGLVGAYNGILTYGKRYGLFDLRPAHQLFDRVELHQELQKVKLPPVRIAVTGGGRVTKGAIEKLDEIGIRRVSVEEYLNTPSFNEAVYTQLNSKHYHLRKDGQPFSDEFYTRPENFVSAFSQFYRVTDLLIAAAFWHPKAPVLFTEAETRRPDFRIRVIADVTCDIDGSIPCTRRASTIDDPIYDYNPANGQLEPPLSSPDNITIMAIDNLPCELPRDASVDFGRDLINNVFPHLFGQDKDQIVAKATIAKNGNLTSYYSYLQDYVDGVVQVG